VRSSGLKQTDVGVNISGRSIGFGTRNKKELKKGKRNDPCQIGCDQNKANNGGALNLKKVFVR